MLIMMGRDPLTEYGSYVTSEIATGNVGEGEEIYHLSSANSVRATRLNRMVLAG